MSDETWIDGFNLLRRWRKTAGLFADARQPGFDLAGALDAGLTHLSRALGKSRGRVRVFMDGGGERQTGRAHGLRVLYPGPGGKADAALITAVDGRGERARLVTVVTSDRALAQAVRVRGARVQTVEDYVKTLSTRRQKNDSAEDRAHKDRTLSPDEVQAWLDVFSEEDEDSSPG